MLDKKEVIAIGCDHAGFGLKEYLKKALEDKGFNVKDFGTDSDLSVDYPDIVHPLASAIDRGLVHTGIIMCGSGNGVAMVANKYPGVRAAIAWDPELARLARQHNNANVLSLPARFITPEKALESVIAFLETGFEGGRHERRVAKIPPQNH